VKMGCPRNQVVVRRFLEEESSTLRHQLWRFPTGVGTLLGALLWLPFPCTGSGLKPSTILVSTMEVCCVVSRHPPGGIAVELRYHMTIVRLLSLGKFGPCLEELLALVWGTLGCLLSYTCDLVITILRPCYLSEAKGQAALSSNNFGGYGLIRST
jgi:hypothetical protein